MEIRYGKNGRQCANQSRVELKYKTIKIPSKIKLTLLYKNIEIWRTLETTEKENTWKKSKYRHITAQKGRKTCIINIYYCSNYNVKYRNFYSFMESYTTLNRGLSKYSFKEMLCQVH